MSPKTLQPPHITRHLQCTAASPCSCNNVGHIARPGEGKQGRFAQTPRPETNSTRCVMHVCVSLLDPPLHCVEGAGGSLQYYKGYCIALDLHWISISASLFRYTVRSWIIWVNTSPTQLNLLLVTSPHSHKNIEHCAFA